MGKKFVVAAYEVDRKYGGPEEGGWWYNTGQLERVIRSYDTEEEAEKASYRFNGLLEKLQDKNKNIRTIYSMAYTGGRYELSVYPEDEIPEYYPEQRPYYE